MPYVAQEPTNKTALPIKVDSDGQVYVIDETLDTSIGTVKTSVDAVNTTLSTTNTTLASILTQQQAKGYGFAGLYEVGDFTYVAKEDGSGNYIIMRIDDSKLGTATDDDTMYASGTGGLPAKAGWSGLTYQDRATTF